MNDENPETCGDHGGVKRDGSPCQRPAGWGTDETTGRCSFHRVGAAQRSVKFDTLKREKYLELLAAGGRRCASARAVGVSYETTRQYRYANPDFQELVELAEQEANEKVETALFDAALAGNVTACLAWLYSRCPERWRDMRNVRHEVEPAGEGTPLERLARIMGVDPEDLPE